MILNPPKIFLLLITLLVIIMVFVVYTAFNPDPLFCSPTEEDASIGAISSTSRQQSDPIGVYDEDDPRLIEIIQTWFLEEPLLSDGPYSFSVENPNIQGQIGVPEIVDRLLGGKRNGFFIECGAYDGEFISNTLLFELERNWTGLLIEANQLVYAQLRRKNRKVHSINACLTGNRHAERIVFKNADVFGGVASLNVDEELQEYQRQSNPTISRVSCFPLYSILLALGNPTVDYFSLDVEGAEWTIVKSLPWSKVNINVISLENNHLGSDNDLVEAFMAQQGYEIKQKIAYDTIFVKKH